MLGKIAAFEIRYQLRQPLFWILFGMFFLITGLYAASDVVHIGDSANVHKNSPYALAETHGILSVFYIVATTAFLAGAISRDDETGFGPMLRTTRVSKFDYLYGRFAGAVFVAALCFASVPIAIALGTAAPWLDKDLIGPLQPQAYAFAYGVLALPDILLTSALVFAVAAVTRSLAWTFVAVIGVLMAYFVVMGALGKPELEPLVAPWDPFGIATYEFVTKYWTASDRNSLTPALGGPMLVNRVFALVLAGGLLALAYPLFSVRAAAGKASSAPAQADPSPAGPAPLARPRFDGAAVWAQLVARTRMDLGLVFKSVAFWVILALGLANAGFGLWLTVDQTAYGGALWPVTRVAIPVLEGAFVIFAITIAGYFAGELVWRDRERRMHEIIDATPAPDWSFVIPKTLAVCLLMVVVITASIVVAVAIQAAKGYDNFELHKYVLWYLLPFSWQLSLMAALAVFIHALSPNRYVGWAITLAYLVIFLTLPRTPFAHPLYIYGRAVFEPLSDMNGQGRFWIGATWLKAYWTAIAVVLLVLAYGLWRRGTETRYLPRLRRLPSRLKGPALWIGAGAVAAAVCIGGYVYFNTNVLNDYRTAESEDEWAAAYEHALLRYEGLPQPSVAQVTLVLDIRPREPMLETRGVYVLENRTAAALREVHVRFPRDLEICALSVQGGLPSRTYDRFNYRIFYFPTPMQPGERRTLSFTTQLYQHGFRARAELMKVVANGTFVNSLDIAPSIGMTRDMLLKDRAKRRKYARKYHLAPDLRPAPLGDGASRAWSYVGHVGWTTSDITVTTDADQVPIAPGYKAGEWIRNGRRTVRFVTEAPILDFFSVQSARYRMKTQRYKDVDLSVYYDPQHPMNVERMLTALRASLDYYQANFSPYQFRQARIVEFPDYARFAQSFAGTFPWSEGLGFIADYRDPSKIDLVTYIAAHEFAHQWWAHQVIGADQQGATVLSETLAQYSALRVMRRLYGPDQIRRFLKFELDNYLRARGGEVVEELPLEKVEDQGYIHYRKGSLVMYRLADEIGEEAVNRALRRLLAQYAFKGAPYPTALDLVAALRAEAPADKQQLITDLFEKITLYDVKTTAARVARRADGRYDVALTVTAAKLYADGQGHERATPMAETLWVGAFDRRPGEGRFGARDVLTLERRPIRSGAQTVTLVTARPPRFVGADPYNELIDRNSDDNLFELKSPSP